MGVSRDTKIQLDIVGRGNSSGGGVTWRSFWCGCAAQHFKTHLFIYMGSENRDPFIYLQFKITIHRNTSMVHRIASMKE